MPLVTTRTMDRAIRDARGLEHPRRLSLAGGSMPFSGRVWIGQLSKITIDTAEGGATKFLYMTYAGAHTWAVVMPDQQPADGQVFDLDQTAGDIHMPGNFAG